MQRRSAPRAERPHMPGYGIQGAEGGAGLLPWSWAEERLAASHNYWLATVRPAGPAHVMPVWGVWLDGVFVFSTGRQSRKARNLVADPRCTITTEHADEAVIVEGVAMELTAPEQQAPFAAAYKAKYNWELDPKLGPIFRVCPSTVFAFIEHDSQFSSTATRWTFATDD